MTEQRTVGDIVNRFRGSTDLQSALAVFTDEEKQGVSSEDLEVILRRMLEHDDHNKKTMDVGIGSTEMWALNANQRQVVEHLLAAIVVAKLHKGGKQ